MNRTQYDYDAAGQILQLINHAPDGSINSRFDYTCDLRGFRTSMATIDGTWDYDHDASGQLIRAVLDSRNAEVPDQDLVYVYDTVGNRIRTITNGVTTEYSTNEMNQYTQVGDAIYEYDDDGNVKSKADASGAWTYVYSSENHLITVIRPDGTWSYEYDPLGIRIASLDNEQRTEYLLDPLELADVIAVYADGRISYVHGLRLASRTNPEGSVDFYAFDAVGKILAK